MHTITASSAFCFQHFLSLLLFCASSFNNVNGFDAEPSVCIVQYEASSNSFSETLVYDDSTSPPIFHAYICTKIFGDCANKGVTLFPSGAHDCFRGTYKPEFVVGSTTINNFFTPSTTNLWRSTCKASIYYDYGLCQVDPVNDRADVTAADLFPSSASNSVLRNPSPPSNVCSEQRCDAGTSSYGWARTISSFTVASPGTYSFTMRGMAKDSTIHTNNPDGTSFSFTVGASTCPAGSQLVGATCVSCIVGKYKIATGAEECASCQPGKYGFATGATTEVAGCSDCPAGRYGSGTASPSLESCVLCAAGKYCEAGSSENTLLCHAGYQGVIGETNPQCTESCPAGFYCVNGTAVGSALLCGSHSTCTGSTFICYCPLGSIQPLQALPGQYTYGGPVGTSNKMTAVESCSPGSYCENGVRTLCPAGTYCVSSSMLRPGPLCTAGFFCPPGSTSRQQQPCSDGSTCDKYCPEGAEQVLTAASGFYTLPLESPCKERTSIQACPAGYLCVNGVRKPRLEYLGGLVDCGSTSNQLSLTMNENTPNTFLLNLQVTEHSASSDIQVPNNKMNITTSICIDNNKVGYPFEIIAGSGANSAPILRTKSAANGGTIHFAECRSYSLTLKVSDSTNVHHSTCSITVTIVDINNAPVWSTPTLVGRFVRERAPKGTTVTRAADGILAASVKALDPDVGQEITYEIVETYPRSKQGDLSLTRCGGVITVQSNALLYPLEIILCIRACDDPSFFGGSTKLCTPSNNSCTNVSVTLENVNDPPTFQSLTSCSTSSPCTIPEHSSSGIAVSGGNLFSSAADQDGDTLQWYLKPTGSQEFSIGLNDGIIVAGATKTDFEVTRAYVLTVMVTDGSNEQQNCISSWCESLLACCATRQVRIEVQNMNDPPVWPNNFAANTQFSIPENSALGTQIGSAFVANDQDQGSSVTYYANDTEREVPINGVMLPSRVRANNVQSGSSSLGQLVVNALIDYEINSTIFVNLVAVDDQNEKAVLENVRITVIDVDEPTIISNTTINVTETTATGTSVLAMSTISFIDPDQAVFGVSLLYSLLPSTFQSNFHISTDGNMLLIGSLDFETLTANPIVLPFSGTQSDNPSLRTNVAYIHVNVLDINEAPSGTDVAVSIHEWVPVGSSSDFTVNGMVVLSFQGSDPENNIQSWSLLSTSNSFAVSPVGVLSVTTASNLNFEDSPVINLRVQVIDSGGLTDDVSCKVTLIDVNDPPIVTTTQTLGDTSTWFSVSKHSSSAGSSSEFGTTGGIVGTLTASDQDSSSTANGTYTLSLVNEYTPHTNGVASTTNTFAISNEGVITVASITSSLETQGSTYKLSVKIQDNGSPPASFTKGIYVIVIAQNFRPTMSDITVNVNEADSSVSTIGTMTANDPDGTNTNIVYSISSILPDLRAVDGERAFVLDINATDGVGTISVNDGYTLNFETTKWQAFSQGVVHITVQAADENGAATVAVCIVNIQDVNEAPSLGSKTYEIGEDWIVGTSIGAALQATDPDAVDTPNNNALKYTTASSHFSITQTGGTITLSQALNFESDSVFNLQVSVADTALNSISVAIKINILDINETPLISDISINVDESSTPGSVITIVNANDPDKASMTMLSFQVSAVSPALKTNFSISQASPTSAYLRHTSLLNYEDEQSYSIQVTVSDNGADFPFANPSAGGSSTSLTATGIVTVNVQDVNDIQIDSIEVNGVVNQAHLTAGGQTVDLIGKNLGPTVSSSTLVSAYYGPSSDLKRYEALNCIFRAPFSTVVRCTTVPGVGNNLLWSLIIGTFNYTSNSLRTKYSIPQITAINGANQMSTQGGTAINIIGTSFGPTSTTDLVVRYGTIAEFQAENWHSATNCVVAVAHINIRCNSIPSSGAPLSWVVVVGEQKSAVFLSQNSGYAPSNLTRVYAVAQLGDTLVPLSNALNTLGGETIEIVGQNFGTAAATSLAVTYGSFTALNCIIVEDHIKIRCTLAPGCGRSLSWSVQLGPKDGYPESSLNSLPRINDPNIQISYKVPTLTQVLGDNVFSASTNGDDFVLLKGSGFGSSAGCNSNCRSTKICGNVVGAEVYYNPKNNNKIKYEAHCCEILSDTAIQCLMAPGTGRNLQWQVKICGQKSAVLDTDTAYGAPVIGSYGAVGSRGMHTEGGETIVLNGLNFGPANGGNIEEVTFGAGNGTEYKLDASKCHVSVAHRQITCTTTKGGGKNHKWAVMIAGQRSTVPTTSYQRPIISTITGPGASNAKMIGGETVIITGDNFGPLISFHQIKFLDSVFYGPVTDPYLYRAKDCVVTTSSTTISCTTVPGNGKLLRWTVTVAGQPSSLSAATTSYGDPVIFSMIPSGGPTSGFQSTLVGINMAPSVLSNALASIMFGSQELSSDISIKNTGTFSQPSGREIQHVTFTVPANVGLNIPVQYRIYTALDKTTYQASNVIYANYSLPQLASIHVANSDNSIFPFKVTLEGANFCENRQCSVLMVNGQPVDRSNILQYSHKAISFRSTEASGNVVLSWKEPYKQISEVSGSFSSLSPTIYPNKVVSFNPGITTCIQTRSGSGEIAICSNINTAGGQPFTVKGVRLGTDINVIQVLVGENVARILSADLFSSVQSITFEIPPGQGLLNDVRVKQSGIGSRADSLIKISYSPPEILSKNSGTRRIANQAGIDLRNLVDPRVATTGAVARIIGSNFGISGKVELRSSSNGLLGTNLQIISWSHTEIKVNIPSGFGSNFQVCVTVGGQTALSDPFGYEAPVVIRYTLLTEVYGTVGGDRVEITGTGFHTSATVTIGGSPCSVLLCNHTKVVALTPQGAGNGNQIIVTVTGGFQSNSNKLFSYPLPELSMVTPNHAPTSGLSFGNNKQLRMNLVGRNFGSVSLTATQRQIFFDNVDVSTNIVSANHTHITMKVPPQTTLFARRTNIVIRIVVKGLSSLVVDSTITNFHYDPPTITSAKVLSCSFASGKSCIPSFPVPTDGCHDWSSPRQRVVEDSASTPNNAGASNAVTKPLDKIIWVDDSVEYFRRCINPVYIELIGTSLGINKFTVSVDSKYNVSDTDCTDTAICTHSHRRIVTRSPYGFGPPPMKMIVNIQQQASNKIPFSFAPPEVAYRGSCGYWSTGDSSSCRLPYNARGTPFVGGKKITKATDSTNEQPSRVILEITGSNFGHEDPGDLRIVIGNRLCRNAKWIKEHKNTGKPYLICYPDEDIVGTRPGSIFLGGQNASIDIKREAFVATCQSSLPSPSDGSIDSYYGGNGQLCSQCPVGAICSSLPEVEPQSKAGFYRLELPTTLPKDGNPTAIHQKKYDRAQGFNNEIRRCSLQQLMNKDLSPELVAEYPYATRPKLCFDFVACEPKSACIGGNNCGVGYEYLYHQCQNWEEARYDACKFENMPKESSCSDSMALLNGSAMIHSSGTLQNIPDPSILPIKYRIHRDKSVDTCLILGKSPIFDSITLSKCTALGGSVIAGMENRTCKTDLDCSTRSGTSRNPGAECTREHPEDCSKCVMHKTTSGETIGMCTCVGGSRCSLCTVGGTPLKNGTSMKGFYRQDNECVTCPDNPWLLFATFGIVVILIGAGAYILNKKKMNMSFISIGVDYFQVLSLFRNAKTKWPPQLLAFFRLLSIFMIDVDIAAPECIVPSLEYSTKWWGTMSIPLLIIVMLLFIYVGKYSVIICKSKCGGNRYRRSSSTEQENAGPDINQMIQLYITFFYYAYIMLAEKGLEVFNCNPTNPDDGFTYTDFTSATYCDGGLCRCYDPSQLQNSLIAPAVILLLIYGLGFPLFVGIIIGKNKTLIKEDQLLRASHLGDTQLTNPYAFQIRQKYGKLYYHFKPGKVYWMNYIIARKVGIAFAGLFFRANPGFQLSFVLLILFVSYVMQVKNHPYMSTSERIIVVEEHMMKVIMAGELESEGLKIPNSLKRHQVYAEHLRVARENKEKADAKSKRDKRKNRRRLTNLDEIAKQMVKEKKEEEAPSYFFDYNTVEQYLLASLILICLSGIMFESDRFSGGSDAVGSHFDWQRELITVMVFTVIALSLIYYSMVFIAEVWSTPQWLHRWQERKHLRKGKRNSSANNIKYEDEKKKNKRGRRDSMQILGDSLQKEAQEILLERKIESVRNEERKRLSIDIQSKERLISEQNAKLEQMQAEQMQANEIDRQEILEIRKKEALEKVKGRSRKKGRRGKQKSNIKSKRKTFETSQNLVNYGEAIAISLTDEKDVVGEESKDENNDNKPKHVHADWWLYTQNGQKYYYNTVSQQSVWNKSDAPELAALSDSDGTATDNEEEEQNKDINASTFESNPMVAKPQPKEEGKPKKSVKDIKSLWASRKAKMRLGMTQKDLWNKQAESRRKNYESHLRAKSNWQKALLKALLSKKKTEGSSKDVFGLIARRGSMISKLNKMADAEKKKNGNEDSEEKKPMSFLDRVKAQIAKEEKEEQEAAEKAAREANLSKKEDVLPLKPGKNITKNEAKIETKGNFLSKKKTLWSNVKSKKGELKVSKPRELELKPMDAKVEIKKTEEKSDMSRLERAAQNVRRMKRLSMVSRAPKSMKPPLVAEAVGTLPTPSSKKNKNDASKKHIISSGDLAAAAALSSVASFSKNDVSKNDTDFSGDPAAAAASSFTLLSAVSKKNESSNQNYSNSTNAKQGAGKSLKDLVRTKIMKKEENSKFVNLVKEQMSRNPIRKGRSRFGDRLRRSSALSLNKAKKVTAHRDLQVGRGGSETNKD